MTDENEDEARTRVEQCKQLILAGRWSSGITEVELSRKHDIPQVHIRNYEAQAIREIMRDAPQNFVEERRIKALGWLERIKHENIDKSPGTVLKAIQLEAQLLGLLIDRKAIQVQTNNSNMSNWSTEELELYAETGVIPAGRRDR